MRKQIAGMCLAGMVLVSGGALTATQSASALYRADEAKSYTIERVFKKGASDRYNIILKAKMDNPQLGGMVDLVMDMIVREKTSEIKEGVAQINSEFDKAQLQLGGLEQEVASQFPKTNYKADKLGRVWDIKSEGGAPELQGGDSSNNERMISVVRSSFYPPKPIKVGDTWEVSVVDPGKKDKEGKEAILGKGKATAKEIEKIAGFEGLQIEVTLEFANEAKAKKPLTFKGVGTIDTVSGRMLKMKGKLDGELKPIGETQAELSLSLMKEDPIKDIKDKKEEKKEKP